jgi:hypothetical protein
VFVKVGRRWLLKFKKKIAFPTGSNGSTHKFKFPGTIMPGIIYDVTHIKPAL